MVFVVILLVSVHYELTDLKMAEKKFWPHDKKKDEF